MSQLFTVEILLICRYFSHRQSAQKEKNLPFLPKIFSTTINLHSCTILVCISLVRVPWKTWNSVMEPFRTWNIPEKWDNIVLENSHSCELAPQEQQEVKPCEPQQTRLSCSYSRSVRCRPEAVFTKYVFITSETKFALRADFHSVWKTVLTS